MKRIWMLSVLVAAWTALGAEGPIARSDRKIGENDWRSAGLTGTARAERTDGETVWHFDGTHDSVAILTESPELDITAELTVSFWFNCRRLPVPGDRADSGTMFGRGWNWEHRITPDGHVRIELQTPTFTPHLISSTAVGTDTWNMVTTVYSGTRQTLQLYLNGELADESVRPDWHPQWGALNPMAGQEVWLGGDPGGYNPFTGMVAGIRIYDRALNAGEIAALFTEAPAVIGRSGSGRLRQLAEQLAGRDAQAAQIIADRLDARLTPAAWERLTMYGEMRLAGDAGLEQLLCWLVKATGGNPIRPDTPLPAEQLGTEIRLVAAPGEYEPASFVLSPVAEVRPIRFEWSDLTGRDGAKIPASNLDLKVVKCWYQAGTAWRDINQVKNVRLLVPELLLNDPELVVVDEVARTNQVRVGEGEEIRYVPISEVAEDRRTRWDMRIANAEFPIRDERELQPVRIAAFANQQFLLTLKVPEDAAPGIYSGTIEVGDGTELFGSLAVKVRVLPFRLAEPEVSYAAGVAMDSSIYYCSMGNDGEGGLTPHERNWRQVEAELRNLAAHGVTNPLNYQLQKNFRQWGSGAEAEFRRMLKLRREAGLKTRPVYLSGPESNLLYEYDDSPEALARIVELTAEVIDVVEEVYGHREVYFYGRDEAAGEFLDKQRRIWEAIHAGGGKVLVAGFKPGMFDATGEVLDLFVACGSLDAAEAARWHANGRRIWSYSNPQGGVENPDIYRRNFGLRLYAAGYDGGCTYLYFEAFGHPWNDFDGDIRDINMVYPTVDGVIDTLAWEGYREGVDDIRYMTTLKHAIAAAGEAGRQEAEQAAAWVAALDFDDCDPDTVRLEMIQWILRLQ